MPARLSTTVALARRTALLGVLAFTFLPLSAGAAPPDTTTLIADVGANDGFSISLTASDGSRVVHLEPGWYTFVVHDHSRIHNFHLLGPNVDKATSVLGLGDSTWSLILIDGVYAFQCDPHVGPMSGSFTVGTPPPPPPPGKLTGTVGPGSTLSLKDGRKRVTKLVAKRYDLTVRDLTPSDNFHLAGPRLDKATGIRFRGTIHWSISLRPGKYTYRCDRRRKSRFTFIVTPYVTSAR
jgi:hypothetical protein